MVDKRSHVRFPLHLEVTLICGGERHSAQSRDVSLGGMFVHTDAKLPFFGKVELRFTMPGLKEESVVEGVVRWHEQNGVGVSFDSLRAREVWALNQLFKKGA